MELKEELISYHALLRFLVATLISFSNQLHQKKTCLKNLTGRFCQDFPT